jgi:hypothetical protein
MGMWGGNPLSYYDPEGLQATVALPNPGGAAVTGIGRAIPAVGAFSFGWDVGSAIYPTIEPTLSNVIDACVDTLTYKGHTKRKRPSTRGKHEAGDARCDRDRGNESGDERRRSPGKPPNDYKGPWPLKQ